MSAEVTNNHRTAPVRACQYIAGNPSADDACKCRRPAMPGSPYCEVHAAICRPHADEKDSET